jgi:hypothetical protein
MTKYFNIYTNGATKALLNANRIKAINQTSTTTTVISYNGAAAADVITITHAADASAVAVQNFLVGHLQTLMSTSYTNAAPVVTLPYAYVSIAVA